MTVKELIAALKNIPEEQQELPVMYMNETWLNEVSYLEYTEINEYGVQDEIRSHIRLNT